MAKRRGWCFWGGWDPKARYELEEPSYWHKYPKQITLCDNNTVILIIRPPTWYTISIICHYFQCQCTFSQILSLFPDFSPLFITFLTVIKLYKWVYFKTRLFIFVSYDGWLIWFLFWLFYVVTNLVRLQLQNELFPMI